MGNQRLRIGEVVEFADHDEAGRACNTQAVVMCYEFPHHFHPDGYAEVIAPGDRLCFGNGDGYRKIAPPSQESLQRLIDYLHTQDEERVATILSIQDQLQSLSRARDRQVPMAMAELEPVRQRIAGLKMQQQEAERTRRRLADEIGRLKGQQQGLATVEQLKEQQPPAGRPGPAGRKKRKR
jgi:hypothetical protein